MAEKERGVGGGGRLKMESVHSRINTGIKVPGRLGYETFDKDILPFLPHPPPPPSPPSRPLSFMILMFYFDFCNVCTVFSGAELVHIFNRQWILMALDSTIKGHNNRGLNYLRYLSPGMRVSTRYVNSTKDIS